MKKSLFSSVDPTCCIAFLIAMLNMINPQVIAAGNYVTAQFNHTEITLPASEHFVSNPLKIINDRDFPLEITLDIVIPEGWKAVNSSGKAYKIAAGDSLIIPLRLVPGPDGFSNGTIQVQVFVLSSDQYILADASFQVHRKKSVRWQISSNEGDRIYFPTGDTIIPFSLRLENNGTEPIDLLLSKKQIGVNMLITDTAGITAQRRPKQFTIMPEEDTTFNFFASLQQSERNHRRIDLDSYQPFNPHSEIRNIIFFRSSLSEAGGYNYTGNRRLDLVRLPNSRTLENTGGALPLSLEANFFNILGMQPVMNLNARGNALFYDGSMLNYQAQVNYYKYEYNSNSLNDVFYRIGYSTRRYDIQFGNISGGYNLVPVSGRGVSGSYAITPSVRTGAYYVQNGFRTVEDRISAAGGFTRFNYKRRANILFQYGHSNNEGTGREQIFGSTQTSVRFMKTQQIGAAYTFNRTNDLRRDIVLNGSAVSGNYSGSFIKRKLTTHLRGTYYTPGYNFTGLPGYNSEHRTVFRKNNKWGIGMQNTHNRYRQRIFRSNQEEIIDNSVYYNQLFVNIRVRNSGFTPSLFYNITNLVNLEQRFTGAGFDYYSGGSITRVGVNLRGGYNRLPAYTFVRPFFTFQSGINIQHQATSFTGRYYYGPQFVSSLQTLTESARYPQALFLSLQQQYPLRNPHFIVQTATNYSYMNQQSRHNLGLYPELFYFTNTNWRFKLAAGYNMVVSQVRTGTDFQQGPNPFDETRSNASHSFFLNAGVKKDFIIPVPRRWSKQPVYDISFIAFLDANGNYMKDEDETVLSNIILKIGQDEIITDDNGKAWLKKLRSGTYAFNARSVYNMQEWYPLIKDSIVIGAANEMAIPFVKGIRLQGKILIQRDRFSNIPEQTDLSRIGITASDSAGHIYRTITGKDGSYLLYLPPGEFTVSMDDKLLGNSLIPARNNFRLTLKDTPGFSQNFYLMEKKRRLNIQRFGDQKKP